MLETVETCQVFINNDGSLTNITRLLLGDTMLSPDRRS